MPNVLQVIQISWPCSIFSSVKAESLCLAEGNNVVMEHQQCSKCGYIYSPLNTSQCLIRYYKKAISNLMTESRNRLSLYTQYILKRISLYLASGYHRNPDFHNRVTQKRLKKFNRRLNPSELIIVSEWLDKKSISLLWHLTWTAKFERIFLPKSPPDVTRHIYINCISHSAAFDYPVMVKSRVCGLSDGESEELDPHFRHVSLATLSVCLASIWL